ncbi:neuropeptide CCHamide-2 receptor-like isoform X2 [Zootermopsis nevadensis]|uniref:Neuromedin-B receptor n=2 Tax=Zootermopsis nevadensis TaxID=136037 RepID=A0A067QN10_ZOONE|nr:neuropeptide CCHamide-2 receptor-like isoform X2 [Zootermopsis nevadensis]KDR09647.1 Neuromedin-B receptor [Zootermopsis nevadensis]
MTRPSIRPTIFPTTSKKNLNQDSSFYSHFSPTQRKFTLDNVKEYVDDCNELDILKCFILLIKDLKPTMQCIISGEPIREPVLSNLSLTVEKSNLKQKLLPNSETSLRNYSALPRTLGILSRVKSNSGKYTISIKTLCNTTNSMDQRGCETTLNTASGSLNEIKITLQNVTENSESLVTHNLTLTLNYSCGRICVTIERMSAGRNEAKLKINSTDDSFIRTGPEEFQLFKHYIDPALYLVILVVGLMGNSFLLFVFVRHREIRATSNIMITNLVACDLLNLILSVPLHYFFKYGHALSHSVTLCRTVFSTRIYFRSVSAFAVVALNIQRCNTITSGLKPPRNLRRHKCKTVTSTGLWILSVWLIPLTTALPSALVKDFYNWHCLSIGDGYFVKIMVVVSVLLYCVVLPSVMFVCSILAARHLKRSARNMPGDTRYRIQEQLRNRSARVMVALAVVFVLSYFPFHVMILLIHCVDVSERNPLVFYSLHVSKHLLFANGCFNPIALIVVSGTFRKLFINFVSCSARQNPQV